MTFKELKRTLTEAVREIAHRSFNVELANVAAEEPPNSSLGDVAFPVAFELAKQIKTLTGEKQNPRAIAETIKAELEKFEFIDRGEIAGPGYLNVYFDRAKILTESFSGSVFASLTSAAAADAPKVCVEHTSVNPNKAAHIGHVRNSVLGDTFHRILKADGNRVEVQNYIDNTGVQVADVVVGFIYLEKLDLEAIKALDKQLAADGVSFDYYCWDLYARVGTEYKANGELASKRTEVLHQIEADDNDVATLADYVATRNVECILRTMDRLSIRYDLLPRESEILHLNFWQTAFEQMKALGVIKFEDAGKNAGCWVMPFDSHTGTEDHDADKILVRSNGTVTYTGKDIAYQMWKLGLLEQDFYYHKFQSYPDGREVWVTSSKPSEDVPDHPDFGGGSMVYNVIDSRQSYTQDVVKKGVAAISPERGEHASVHLSYEMVALSPAAAEELGFELLPEDRERSFIEMSGRKGLGVKADDLIDRLEANALAEVERRHPEMPGAEKRTVAHQLAVGALRYFLLKFTRSTLIVFDFNEALSFEGETGAFCQYSAVRANSIFRKLNENGIVIDPTAMAKDQAAVKSILADPASDVWSLTSLSLRLEDVVHQAAGQNEPAILAKYAFNLAKAFNLFYHHNKIVGEPDPQKQAVLIAAAAIAKDSLTTALGILGIEVPEKM